MATDDENILVEINNLFVNFYTYQGVVQAIEGVDLVVKNGETLGLVGETGCGKSVTASSIMKLILSPPGKIESGSVYFMEPPEVRAKRREYEAEARAWFTKLPEVEKKKLTATYTRFTGFKKRVKPLTSKDVDKTVVPDIAPPRVVSLYLANKASKLPKNDKMTQDAVRKNYDLLSKSNVYMQKIRGKFISMIFQEPTSALNPVFTAGDQIAEVIMQHRKTEMAGRVLKRLDKEIELIKSKDRPRKLPTSHTLDMPEDKRAVHKNPARRMAYECSVCHTEVSKDDDWCDNCGVEFHSDMSWRLRPLVLQTYKRLLQSVQKNPDSKNPFISRIPLIKRYKIELYDEAFREAVRMLEVVRIPDPKGVAIRYPYELSGGMQQRVMIAIALACNPKLLIADEPTTALDVTIQGQILKLMRDLKEAYGSSILLITHNLGVVAEMCDRVGVMYAGSMAEVGISRDIFKRPMHPYTQGLMKAVPSIQMEAERLYTIRGSVPNLIYPPSGCRFHPRCDYAKKYCERVKPELTEIENGHFASCHMVAKAEEYVRE
jgi:peptide/nickel transport system ATP-binding protein